LTEHKRSVRVLANGETMKEIPKDIFQKFLQLSSELSPENLHCDGEISNAQAHKKYRAIIDEWHKLEKKLGRTVTEDEIWQIQMKEYEMKTKMKTIKLPCYNMVIEVTDEKQGTITSNLHQTAADLAITADEYDASVNAIESLILAHACAGIDISCPAYVEGIETAVEAILNHTT